MQRPRAKTESSSQGDDHGSDTRIKPAQSENTAALVARRGSLHDVHPSQDHNPSAHSPYSVTVPLSPRQVELKAPTSTELTSTPDNTTETTEMISAVPTHILTSVSEDEAAGKRLDSDLFVEPEVSSRPAPTAEYSLTDPWSEHRAAYEQCPIEPPITPETMLELESTRIFNNAKLRHDVNFDRELHFKPNSECAKGRLKQREADRYWKAVEWELHLIEELILEQSPTEDVLAVMKRVPAIFRSVRDILYSLVPEPEQHRVLARLDVPLMTQMISHGICDLDNLATWLAAVIKTHCAPMRDAKVNAFESAVLQSKSIHDLDVALSELLNIMEAMKLDVANHQIRHIRVFLIANTIDFQQRYNLHRIEQGKIDVHKAVAWLNNEVRNISYDQPRRSPVEALCRALLRDIMSPRGHNPYPPTFYLDFARLREIGREMHFMVMSEVCRSIAGRDIAVDAIGLDIDNLAAEIARDDQERLSEITNELKAANPKSPIYAHHKKAVFHRMLPRYQDLVLQHIGASALELHDTFVPVPPARKSRFLGKTGARLVLSQQPVVEDQDANLIRRLSHLTILNWQVWAGILQHYGIPTDALTPPDAQADVAVGQQNLSADAAATGREQSDQVVAE